MGLFSGITDALFGDPNQSLNAQQKSNNQSREYTKEMADQARGDANRLYYESGEPLRAGYQAALDALGGTTRHQMRMAGEGNYLAQAQLLAGMPQFQNAIMGLPVDNSALQPQRLDPEKHLQWMFNAAPGIRSGGHDPREGIDPQVLKDLQATGLTPQNWADLAWAKQAFEAQGGPANQRKTLEQIYNKIYGGK